MKRSLIILVALAAAASLAAGSPRHVLIEPVGRRRGTVSTGSSSLGRILVDGNGRTLYLFEKDPRGGAPAQVPVRPTGHRCSRTAS